MYSEKSSDWKLYAEQSLFGGVVLILRLTPLEVFVIAGDWL